MLYVDFPSGGMRFADVDIRVEEEELPVPLYVSEAAFHLEEVIESHPLPPGVVFNNNPCLIVARPPILERREIDDWERPGIRITTMKSTYFIKLLARGNIPPAVLEHVRRHWNSDYVDPEDIRSHLARDFPPEESNLILEGFHPLRHPNLGIAVAPIIEDGGRVYTAWAKRSSMMATNPGRFGVPVNEGIVPSDQDRNSNRIDLRRAFLRGFREEVGGWSEDPTFGIGGIILDVDGGGTVDRNGVRCGGGLSVIGWARVAMAPEDYVELLPRDRFEVEFVDTTVLDVPGLAGVLASQHPSAWFPPAVLAYASALEHVGEGGSLRLSRALERLWSGTR